MNALVPACAALLVLLSDAPRTQIISWGPVQQSLAASDVSLNGALVVARNLHGGNASPAVDATANGVTFVGGFQPNGWNGFVTTGMNGSSTGDAGYDLLLNGARAMTNGSAANPSGWGGIRLDTLATLRPGGLYEIQVWYTDQRTGTASNVLYDRVMTLSSAWGTASVTNGEVTNLAAMVQGPLSGAMDADPDNAPAVNAPDTIYGTHCTGTFTYVPGGETWLVVQGSHPIASNNLRPHVTALQIRDVSPAGFATTGAGCPSSVGLASLSVSGLPVVGGTLQVDMANVSPVGVPLMIGGATAVSPYMISLAGLTTDPTCLLLTDPGAVVGPLSVVGGTATFSLPVPNNGALVGFELFLQGAQYEAAGVSLTEQGIATVGL